MTSSGAAHVSSFLTFDELKIHTIAWLPLSTPKAVVLLAHGIGEHSGRYAHVAARLTTAGYALHALDHRGHGYSDGLRVHFDSFQQPVTDLKQYADSIRKQYPDTKIFLYGHSMGSLISTLFALSYQDQFAGLISSGSPLAADHVVPKPLLWFGHVLKRLMPKLPFAAFDSSHVSRDDEVVAAYDNDPLVYHGRFRVRIGHDLLMTARDVRERLHELTLPMLIMHGGADKLVPSSGSQMLYDRASSDDKTLKIYPELYHEIHNEPEQLTVLDDIVAWLDAHS